MSLTIVKRHRQGLNVVLLAGASRRASSGCRGTTRRWLVIVE
jgi:hypothetical protein